jgi:hypothetical protein
MKIDELLCINVEQTDIQLGQADVPAVMKESTRNSYRISYLGCSLSHMGTKLMFADSSAENFIFES